MGRAAIEPPTSVAADADELALFDLADSLDVLTAVASAKATTLRQSPGILTHLTREEIQQSGARDLLDILLLIPGFTPALDTQGVVGLGFRGLWGQEGKILLVIDGLEMNEPLYGNLSLGYHYPVDTIDSLEVIRGPGSARYGGHAELAVINVTTRSGRSLQGGAATATYGEMPNQFGRAGVTVEVGSGATDGGDGLEGSVSAFVGEANRGNGTYLDPSGVAVPVVGNQTLQPLFLNAGASFQGFKLRAIYDQFRQQVADGYGPALADAAGQIAPQTQSFTLASAALSYAWKLSDRVEITPRLELRHDSPWEVTSPASPLYNDIQVDKYLAGIRAAAELVSELNLSGGVEGYVENARNANLANAAVSGVVLSSTGGVTYRGVSVFAEALWETVAGNFVAGARYEAQNAFGSSFVPRLAYTAQFGPVHGKLLYNRAYRPPDIVGLAENPTVVPEITTDFEAELGVDLGAGVSLSADGFDTTLKGPVIFTYSPALLREGYLNGTELGSRGVEADLHLQRPGLLSDLSFSFYTNAYKNQVANYAVPGSGTQSLGLPQVKIAYRGSYQLPSPALANLALAPAVIFLSQRFGYTGSGAGGTVLESFGPTTFVDFFVHYRDLGVRGLGASAGVHNLLDQTWSFVQAYNAGHPPLPGLPREFVVKLSYELKL